MAREFTQLVWDDTLADDCRQLVRLAVREDLERLYDWTTVALVSEDTLGEAAVIARQPGVVAGLPAAQLALDEMDVPVNWQSHCQDGACVAAGQTIATMAGPARDLLTAERLLLNLLGRLSGIATHTRRYVDAVSGTAARIYDTRKTTPGWRRLEKYAVRCGGAQNHRTGLFDAVLIKDNHLALLARESGAAQAGPDAAVGRVRRFLQETAHEHARLMHMLIEVEVDTLEQLDQALRARPDIVLLDNMPLEHLREAVRRRNESSPETELEASGGVTLETIRGIAETGVERISVGALTHSAVTLDVALDWG